MSVLLPNRRPFLGAPWVKNALYSRARAVPSLDLRFAESKSLVDATTGQNLISFTRASSGTYVDSQGVIRTATTNLLLRSEEFDNASWIKAGLLAFGSGSTANAIIAPNGSTTADLLTEDSSTGQHRVYQTVSSTANASAYTLSVYVKAKERTRFYVGIVDSPGFSRQGNAIFNLSNGTVFSASAGLNGATGGTATIQDVGNGWYRCSYSLVLGGTNTAIFCDLNIVSTGSTISYTGDGTSGIYLWGAQLEQSSTVGEYIPTTSTINSAPRFDHNPTTGESLGLLVEESRTNSIRNNTMVGAAAGTPGTLPTNWIGAGSSGLAREVVGTGTESGIAYVDVRYFGTTTSALYQNVSFEVTNQIAAAQSSIWTSTAFVKLVGGSLANITSAKLVIDNYNSSNVSLGQYAIGNFVPTTAALIAQRYSVSSTSSTFSNAATAFVRPYLQFEANSGVAIDITLRIGLPQLEQGAFATSVIPTSTAAATRSADVASISGSNFSGWHNTTEGTLYADSSSPGSSTTVLAISDGTGSNRILLDKGTNVNRGIVTVGGVSQAQVTTAYTYNTALKAAFAYVLDSVNIAGNGLLGTLDTSASIPTVSILYIGSNAQGALQNNGPIKRLTYWPRRLSDATLQSITQ